MVHNLFTNIHPRFKRKKPLIDYLSSSEEYAWTNQHLHPRNDNSPSISESFPTYTTVRKEFQCGEPDTLTTQETPFPTKVEKQSDRNLALSLAALSLNVAAKIMYPPLSLLSVPILLYTSFPFFQSAYRAIFVEKRVKVALVDAISIGGCFVMGYYFVISIANTFIYISQKMLRKTERQAAESLAGSFGEQPRAVWVLVDEVEVELPFAHVQKGDIAVVYAGQTIPVDGTITMGNASVDQRALTGESQPVEKMVGDICFASTMLLSGKIHLRVDQTGTDTVAAQIGTVLENTTDFMSTIQSRGQKIIDQGALPTLASSALALVTLGVPSALAALFSAFGYHMRLVAPISVLNFLRVATAQGILIKDGRALELLSKIDTVVFDKTGTLTEEIPTVAQIVPCHGHTQNELLTFAAAAEYKQTHPIAQAIQYAALEQGLVLPPTIESQVDVGYGLKVRLESQVVMIGSRRYMGMEEIAIPTDYATIQEAAHDKGHSLVYVAIDGQFGGVIELCPTVRPEVNNIVHQLRRRNITIYIISGDHEEPTRNLAETLGIDHYFAETLPQNKAQLIEQLQSSGRSVCFVGDGINDSVALKQANVSISLNGASAAATDTANILLMDGTLNQLLPLFDIATEMEQNLSRSIAMTVVPGIICISGIFFLHFGLLTALFLYNIGLATSVANAMLPWFNHQGQLSDQP